MPVDTAFFTVSVSGWSANLNCWLTVGDTGVGDVSVTPVTASVTAAVPPDAPASEGRAGLAFVHAVVATSSASALQIAKDFSFMCSYRGLETLLNYKDDQSATRAGRPVSGCEGIRGYEFRIRASSSICNVHAEIQLPARDELFSRRGLEDVANHVDRLVRRLVVRPDLQFGQKT